MATKSDLLVFAEAIVLKDIAPKLHPLAKPRLGYGRVVRGYWVFWAVLLLWFGTLWGAFTSNTLLAWSAGLLYITYDTWLIAYIAWKNRHLAASTSTSTPIQTMTEANTLSVGVIVSARDEEDVLEATINTLLLQSYQPKHILIVNDGSTDNTATLLAEKFALPILDGWSVSTRYPHLSVLHKKNSGKADSMNQACRLLDVDVVMTVDADTRLSADALAAMYRAFVTEPQLVAACGVLTPRCKGGLLAQVFAGFQHFEYLRAFLSRAAWMQSNALLLVSGALAAYRREMLMTIGGYDPHSLVEDYELIHRLHRHACDNGLDWRVKVLPEARAETDAPASFRAFLHQRRRWFAGFLQTQFQYRAMQGEVRYRSVGRLMLPIKAADTLQPVYGMTAFILLCIFIASGAVFAPLILLVIAIKLVIDFSYHLWAIRLYHRWLQQPIPSNTWWYAVFSTLAEPFSFQLLRHVGALWGWIILLTGHQDWVPQRTMRGVK